MSNPAFKGCLLLPHTIGISRSMSLFVNKSELITLSMVFHITAILAWCHQEYPVELLFPLVCCPSSCSYSCTFALVTEELACCHCLSYYSLILAIRFGLNLGAGIGVGSSVAIIIAGPTTKTVILSLTR